MVASEISAMLLNVSHLLDDLLATAGDLCQNLVGDNQSHVTVILEINYFLETVMHDDHRRISGHPIRKIE